MVQYKQWVISITHSFSSCNTSYDDTGSGFARVGTLRGKTFKMFEPINSPVSSTVNPLVLLGVTELHLNRLENTEQFRIFFAYSLHNHQLENTEIVNRIKLLNYKTGRQFLKFLT